MIDPNEFDATLRHWLKKESFVPFFVELDDGQNILIRQPVLAFGGGSASFIDSVDGALVGFSHQQVIGFHAAGQEVFVSASMGLALYPLDGDDGESLIKNAGAAMHFAKDQGRDNYQFYSRAMNATALEKLAMESQLRKALERDELLLHYQPKIRASTGEIIGVEALIRWRHPELGMVPPGSLIDCSFLMKVASSAMHHLSAMTLWLVPMKLGLWPRSCQLRNLVL